MPPQHSVTRAMRLEALWEAEATAGDRSDATLRKGGTRERVAQAIQSRSLSLATLTCRATYSPAGLAFSQSGR